MKFSQVVGQQSVKEMVVSAAAEDRLAHAYLLLGPAGLGALPLALSIAQYVMCKDRQATDPCGQCSACHKVGQHIHPDLHFTFPTIKSKSAKTSTSLDWMKEWREFLLKNPYGSVQDWLLALGGDNKQGNITKDECVRIVKTLGLKSYESEYRIQIIWMAEYLAKEGNRLLKLIEEPSDKTIFILIAEDEDRILNTIYSRCQILRMKPVPTDKLSDHLTDSFGLTKEEALRIAGVARGNTGHALKLVSADDVFGAASWLEWMRILYKKSPQGMVDFADRFAQFNREAQKAFLNYGLHFMRELITNQHVSDVEIELPDGEKIAAQKLGQLLSAEGAFQTIALLEESIHHLERYANPRLVMLDNSIQISRWLDMKSSRLLNPKKASA